jgi:SAM-dependent methyltransferase
MSPAPIAVYRNRQAWRTDAPEVRRREAGVLAAIKADPAIAGVCGMCGRKTVFAYDGVAHSLREGLRCGHCHCNARQRAAADVLWQALAAPERASVYATEQASPFYLALRQRVGHLSGGEYAGFWRRARLALWMLRHGAPAWVRNGDVTALRRRDAAVDAVMSLDVLEHVPDYAAALSEFARVLRPGGVLVLTVPFYEDSAGNTPIARIDARGRIEHLAEPEFHGDPIRGGVACFHHFGWDLLVALRDAGFSDAVACRLQDPARGLPQGQWVLRAQR